MDGWTRIKDIISPVKGFFTPLSNPIYSPYITGEELDLLFFGKYGNKITSPLLDYYIKDETLTDEDRAKISQVIYKKYYHKWKHLLQTYHIIDNEDWNITENYSLIREVINKYGKGEEVSHTGTDSTSYSGADTTTHTGTHSTDYTGEDTTSHSGADTDTTEYGGTDTIKDATTDTQNKRNAFNSSSEVNTDRTTTNDSQTRARGGTDTTTHNAGTSETLTRGTKEATKQDLTDTLTKGTQETLTRGTNDKTTTNGEDSETTKEHGSVGVSSAAEQVLKNKETMEKVDLIEMIIADYSHELTINIY